MNMVRYALNACMFSLLLFVTDRVNAQLNIVINPGADLQNNQAALDAFERAATQWEAIFTDNITININADFFSFGPGNSTVLGSAGSQSVEVGFDLLRNELIADGLADGDDITQFLPTFSQLNTVLPTGGMLSGNIALNSANLRAIDEDNSLGIALGAVDGQIQFNSDFNFDFDNSDGVAGFDFETVAAHEIGHVLGFVSEIDRVDVDLEGGFFDNGNDPPGIDLDISVSPLDLFRFENGNIPIDEMEFTDNARVLSPGVASSFSDTLDVFGLSTGEFNGDGRQASHFLDNGISGELLGIFDPTLAPGAAVDISFADVRTVDLIGFNFLETSAVPEPSSAFLLVVFCGLAARRRRRV